MLNSTFKEVFLGFFSLRIAVEKYHCSSVGCCSVYAFIVEVNVMVLAFLVNNECGGGAFSQSCVYLIH